MPFFKAVKSLEDLCVTTIGKKLDKVKWPKQSMAGSEDESLLHRRPFDVLRNNDLIDIFRLFH